jgi:hypothetical protein
MSPFARGRAFQVQEGLQHGEVQDIGWDYNLFNGRAKLTDILRVKLQNNNADHFHIIRMHRYIHMPEPAVLNQDDAKAGTQQAA